MISEKDFQMKIETSILLIKTLFISFVLYSCFGSLYLYFQSNVANAGKIYVSFLGFQERETLQLKVVVVKTCTITAQYNHQPNVY